MRAALRVESQSCFSRARRVVGVDSCCSLAAKAELPFFCAEGRSRSLYHAHLGNVTWESVFFFTLFILDGSLLAVSFGQDKTDAQVGCAVVVTLVFAGDRQEEIERDMDSVHEAAYCRLPTNIL